MKDAQVSGLGVWVWVRTAVATLLLTGPTFAQLSTASINGVVRDSTGAIIPEAEIVLRNVDTTVERRSVSNESGNYVFLNIVPGQYTLEATKAGFRTSRVTEFRLAVNQTATLDFSLDVGTVEQSISVEAIGAEVRASTAELGAVVTKQQVVDLPLNGRNFTQLLVLTPGVSPISVSQNSNGGFTASAIGSFTFPSINGQTNRSNFFTLDGINNQEPFNSTYAVPPIVDTIQEFKVNSHNDQAEFGGVMGGVINVVTKSGTNELHGSAWEFLRNDAFDARNFFLPAVTTFRWNQYGAAAGGPVVLPKIYDGKNRTFFYVGYQGYKLRQPTNTLIRVPTPANLTGDLSDSPKQIYNPFSTRPDPANPNQFIRDPFPGNRIPTNLIDQRMVQYAQETFPAPAFTGVADRNAIDATPRRVNQEEYTARVDQNFGTRNSFFFRYSGLLFDRDQSGGRPSLAALAERRAKNWGINWIHVFDPSSTLQVQFGRSHTRQDDFNRFRNLPANFFSQVGISPEFGGGFIGGVQVVPAFNIIDFVTGGESDSLNFPVNVWQYKGNYSKIIGRHTLRMGGEWNYNNFESQYRNANSDFRTPQTADPNNLAATGSQIASFLLNVPDAAGRRNVHETMRLGGVMGFYFHDQWKATSRLTINLGLRYDRTFIPPYGGNGSEGENGGIETGSLDLNRGVYLVQKLPPTCAERRQAPCIPDPTGKLPDHVEIEPRGKIYHDTTMNFQPRFGIAFRASNRTAVRASFGMFFDNWAAVTQTAQNYEGAWPDAGQQLGNNLNYPTAQSAQPVVQGQKPFLQGLLPEPTPFNQVQWFMDPHAKNPYSMQWNFGVQHQLDSTTVVSANYVGSGARRLDVGGYYNVALTPGPASTFRSRAPFPYIAPTFYDRSWGTSSYNSFQFDLNRSMRNGLVFMVAYTWSRSMDTGCSGWYGVEGCSVQNPYDLKKDARSVSGFDIPHLLSVNSLYEIPVGKGKKFSTGNNVADYIIGGWQFNGIAVLRSGQPYGLSVDGDVAGTGNTSGYMRPNQVGIWQVSEAKPERWFNTAAFASPVGTFGNVGRYALRSDGFVNFDLSIFRKFPIKEAFALEFRAESFNTFNHPTFSAPTGNLSNVNFGKVLTTNNPPRQLQFGLKVYF